ncbi:sigma 54-interacting transcriptional regulator [Bacillus sp. 31A1R]|uniref:Sigma 54-interacting transcriptional regulator n=1 Tax=Robertmurraya mangrovi TaxID=3098077 RepID=A0ABU5J0U8_9BACI|nr:sigma 54-interacting transcriptional regulator [Bacillus sp. 31A1R]MDZ5473019.1 sigma 54-interacting transcriptional regulator [Bacillus sp. 31A1R]
MIEFKDMISPVDCVVTEDTTLQEIVQLMQKKKWNTIPVTNLEGECTGVFTRSGLFQMILDEKPLTTSIHSYIKREAKTIYSNTTFNEVERVVQQSEVGTGIVVDEKRKVIGLFTKTDMVLSLLNSSNSLRTQLETILQHTNMGVMMTDERSHILYVNERVCSLIDQAPQVLHNQCLLNVFPGLKGKVNSNQIIQLEINHTKFILHFSPYQTAKKKKGYIILFQHLTEIETLAQELESVKNLKSTLETAIDSAYDGILMTDDKTKVQMVSPSLLELFNLQKEDVIYKPVENVFPQFNLTPIFKSETAEISEFLEINGIKYIVHKLPILQDGKCIGVIAKVVYRQLNEVSELFKKLQRAENKANYYHSQYEKAELARFTWDHILSTDPYMEKLKKSAAKAAKGRSTVLIRGESGTGKELFAHAIHNSSARREGKFVIVNCAAIPEDLLESEFFGYEEGAFTGAKQRGKIGKFDLANGGTLFLDEIGDMSLSLQAKLLRVLQEREFYRVGGTKKIQVDVRIIAATNRPLEEMVEEGQFREDLYYRLNVISLNIPPLRNRMSDVEHLLEHLLVDLNNVLGTSITGIDLSAKDCLLNYDWPGNVRELRNVMERAMTFAEHGRIQLDDLPDYMIKKVSSAQHTPSRNVNLVEELEIQTILKVIDQTNGNKAKAARILGISRSGLYEKIKKYQLKV